MKKLYYVAAILLLLGCKSSKNSLKKVKVVTYFYLLLSEQYIYMKDKYTLYFMPILSDDDRLANYEELPPNFICYLEESNMPMGLKTSCYNGKYAKIKLIPVDSILKALGSLYSRDKAIRPAYRIYEDNKVINTAYSQGNTIETLVPNVMNDDCSYADTTYVTYNRNYNWVTNISLSDDEKKRGIKISKVHHIFNARYCSEYKQSIDRRTITYSLEEIPIKNPAKIDAIFAKLIPLLPKK